MSECDWSSDVCSSDLIMETTFGVTVRADWPHLIRITVPSTYNGTLGGLCGNLNGYRGDEFLSPVGVLLNDSQAFGNSWRDGSFSAYCEESTETGKEDIIRTAASSCSTAASWLHLMDRLLSATAAWIPGQG